MASPDPLSLAALDSSPKPGERGIHSNRIYPTRSPGLRELSVAFVETRGLRGQRYRKGAQSPAIKFPPVNRQMTKFQRLSGAKLRLRLTCHYQHLNPFRALCI